MRRSTGSVRTAIIATVIAAALPAVLQAQQPRRLPPAPPAPEDQFFQSQGAHFTVLFEGAQDDVLARAALDILEDGYNRVGVALNTFPTRNVTVVLYTEQQFHDVTQAPDWAAGAYDGKIRVPLRGALAQPEELTRVLVHELTHAMLHATVTRGLPAWLNEGLAVNFEPHGTAWAEQELAKAARPLPFSVLGASFKNLSGADARTAYAESAVLTHRLMQEAGGTTLNIVLQDLNAGESFEAAFAQRFLMPFDTFAASLFPER
jgi:hypothetical protein